MGGEAINVVLVLLLFFGFTGMMRSRGLGRRHRQLQEEIDYLRAGQASAAPVLSGPSKEQVERLEDRVRVLERIVTDGNYSLASQIEALREPAPSEGENV